MHDFNSSVIYTDHVTAKLILIHFTFVRLVFCHLTKSVLLSLPVCFHSKKGVYSLGKNLLLGLKPPPLHTHTPIKKLGKKMKKLLSLKVSPPSHTLTPIKKLGKKMKELLSLKVYTVSLRLQINTVKTDIWIFGIFGSKELLYCH